MLADVFQAKSPIRRENDHYKNWLKITKAPVKYIDNVKYVDGEYFTASLDEGFVKFTKKDVLNIGRGKTKSEALRDLMRNIRGREILIARTAQNAGVKDKLKDKFSTPWFIV